MPSEYYQRCLITPLQFPTCDRESHLNKENDDFRLNRTIKNFYIIDYLSWIIKIIRKEEVCPAFAVKDKVIRQ